MVLLLLWSPTVYAWNAYGHMLSAAIAYYELAPVARAEVVRMLRAHPRWVTRAVAPVGLEDAALFMAAACWADEVRGDPTWDRPEWHYINVPIVRDGVTPAAPAVPNLVTALEDAMETLRKPAASDAERAVALAWLFHLVGDAHQPLHAVSLFSALFPGGDRGGTRFYARVGPGLETINLHYLWDNLLGQEQGVRALWNRATTLLARGDLQRETFPDLAPPDVGAWVEESVQLARTAAYPPTLVGSRDRYDGAVLPDGYSKHAREIAERRVMLAGYRLAGLLSKLLVTGDREER